ncbi:carbohydrate ABC transporter permease [Lawsonibacter faecis]|jgi:putative ABC-type sugar transport system, permease component|uniref:Sugar ABC transporter permease n=1 Tax=Lawsonibacter faecis TaxID=2763052 RepID=A0A8J6J9S6_9FIRM|nr:MULTISPECIES: sugar ABC transporter permease [Oscillospiraceae]MTQ97867.1 ABC transporter permease subunit [Pseudoflavonifractor sp. BIOML-A16]MTR04553.1 ABC transporter permease subunit [Pseudoflavonifractor sp. BIOML-A15]MTR33547.1 ABC transporter permease subunit [Pseudoflavonifractor sp. BIOML-A14]MTR71764.1 ABC transporter permease subunit [Pseudoflavonifractor sp. BIOML-A18]MTS62693.1 ABC transporter permease subunit [Pseudoflavonifractor sp. BIOML-A5]MTS71713.1 ABC transporter perme
MGGSTLYKKKTPLIVFLVPAFIFLILFLYYPFVQNIINSFSDITGLGTAAKGLNDPWYANYVTLFTDPKLHTALKNTLILTLATIVFQVGIALILALLVDSIRVGAQVFRTLYFFPIVISATALGLMFNLIFLYKGGMVNQLLLSLGAITENINWKDEAHFMFTMLMPVMWQYVGFYFVILVTGLNNISPDLYEAASLDGASGLKTVRYITLPMLRNVLCTCLVLAITGALKVFDLPWVMFGAGMPLDQGWLTGTYMYDQTFNRGNVDYGSTIAMLIVVLGVVLSNVANRVFRPRDDV